MLQEIIANVSETTGLPKGTIKEVVNVLIEEIKNELYEGEEVNFYGFGKFTTYERSARKGRNPGTGEELQIKASTQVKFKPSSGLKKFINS